MASNLNIYYLRAEQKTKGQLKNRPFLLVVSPKISHSKLASVRGFREAKGKREALCLFAPCAERGARF